MASEATVANQALFFLGRQSISSLDDSKPDAIAINTIFDTVRDQVLAMHPWNSAIKRDQLTTEASPAPEYEFDNAYDLPADFISLVSMQPPGEEYPFRIENGQLLTDATDPYIKYVYQNTDPATWSPLLQRAVAYQLAIDVSQNVTGSDTKMEMLRRGLDDALSEARYQDAKQSPESDRLQPTSYLEAHHGSRYDDMYQ